MQRTSLKTDGGLTEAAQRTKITVSGSKLKIFGDLPPDFEVRQYWYDQNYVHRLSKYIHWTVPKHFFRKIGWRVPEIFQIWCENRPKQSILFGLVQNFGWVNVVFFFCVFLDRFQLLETRREHSKNRCFDTEKSVVLAKILAKNTASLMIFFTRGDQQKCLAKYNILDG